MALRCDIKRKVRCDEKLYDNKDRLLGETVETPILNVFKNSIDKYEGTCQCTAPYLEYEAWNK